MPIYKTLTESKECKIDLVLEASSYCLLENVQVVERLKNKLGRLCQSLPVKARS